MRVARLPERPSYYYFAQPVVTYMHKSLMYFFKIRLICGCVAWRTGANVKMGIA